MQKPNEEMTMQTTIIEKLQYLSPEDYEEVLNFIDSLLTKKVSEEKKKPKLEWIGGLIEYQGQYTALELQNKASDWRD